jgi:hypothetical protein
MTPDMRRWGPFLSLAEPELDVLATELERRIKTRQSPISSKVVHVDDATASNIKKILLKCTPQTLQLLTSERLEDIIPSHPHLPDIQYPYPGVYAGMYLHADGTAPSIRDAIRVANIIIRPAALREIFEGMWLGVTTKRGLKLYGYKLRERLTSIESWHEVDEFGLEEIEVMDEPGEEDDSDDPDYISEETAGNEKYPPLPIPNHLKDPKFDGRFPWTSVYVGYTKDFNRRKKVHASSNSFAGALTISAERSSVWHSFP